MKLDCPALLWWLLCIPAAAGFAALATGALAAKLGVALGCALILWMGRWDGSDRAASWVIAALVLSAGGDWFLCHRAGRESYFLAGIALFFGAHLGFLKYAWGHGRLDGRVLAGLLSLYLPYYWFWLRPAVSAPILAMAVLAYLLISCLGLSVAAGMRGSLRSKVLFVAGIALIVFSDTCISLNEFLHWRDGNWLILPTYYLSHLSIAGAVLSAPARTDPAKAGSRGNGKRKAAPAGRLDASRSL
jgi:hypothetical protein